MWFVTFNFAQQYKLAGDPHHQHMTGCCLVKTGESGWEMLAFHLGGANGYIPDSADDPQRVDHVAEPSPGSPKLQRRENVRTLGEIVKANRIRHDLTLRELAERCGLSASFLSQVERSLTDPSVGSIRQIAAGLNMTAAEIISETESGSPGVLLARPGDRTVIAAPHTGGHLETFPAIPGVGLRSALLVFEPHVMMTASDGIHDHDEMIYVLSGSVEITADALRVILVEGDGATVRAGCRHSYRPLYGATVRLLVVTAEPSKHSNKSRDEGAEP
ncbi:cupin domain-containing protein [Mycobacterium antarcticum]|uniref:cupin domain-containing protein n=1 Tax=Mycolicibacterium sp. TUM20984 TaxID=3023368 RepID=UPI0024E0AFE1|nr:XRE family transcriptional regulator [Mycolicibacterium sp. TUM20984]